MSHTRPAGVTLTIPEKAFFQEKHQPGSCRFMPRSLDSLAAKGIMPARSLKPADAGPPPSNQMSGNPVRIGDGCATVTGYKLPMPLVYRRPGRRERGQARSQDTGLVVLVVAPRHCGANFSVKEKDEASLPRVCARDSLNAFILRLPGSEGFLFSDSALVSQSLTLPAAVLQDKNERP